jgi:hypothetical protein
MTSNQLDVIEKARYRYGRKGSMTTLTFKKYQAPFKTKQNQTIPTSNGETTDIDRLISTLNKRAYHNSPMNNKEDENNTKDANINSDDVIIMKTTTKLINDNDTLQMNDNPPRRSTIMINLSPPHLTILKPPFPRL